MTYLQDAAVFYWFQQAGYQIVKAVEFDKQIADSYVRNHSNVYMLVDDISEVDNENYFSEHEADVIIGGPVGVLMSAKSGSMHLKRPKKLSFNTLNIVKIVNRFLCFENVRNFNDENGKILKKF